MTEQEQLQKKESEFLKVMMIIALSVLLGVGGAFGYFFEFTPSRDLKTWVDTATIFTGVATPILTVISVFLLYFVWKDNRRELAETKKALIEQSDTQNFSVIKDAVFEVADEVKELLQLEVKEINKKISYTLLDIDNPLYEVPTSFLDIDWDDEFPKETIRKIKQESILEKYFFHMKGKSFVSEEKEIQFENIIFTDTFFKYIDKVKTIALFMRALKSREYKGILEITLFSKLTIFTWLFFVEIAFHLLKTAKVGEKETAELVFAEIAGLTCRQLKEVYWIDALSDEVLLELKARKLL
ncbi:hypothetical protein R0K04_12670 [Pseudoalteromonas sp. SIMBA_153]